MKENTKQWVDGYLDVSELTWLKKLRLYFQQKVFADFVADKSKKILDVGCGNGTFLEYLRANHYENIYGVEPNETLVQRLEGNHIKQGFSHQLPFDDGQFEVIYFFNVFHHVHNLETYRATLHEVHRCLAPGGLVIMVEPCNRYIYAAKRLAVRILAPVSRVSREIYQMMMEEKQLVTFFFDHHGTIREQLKEMNYNILRDRKLFHQWTFVTGKPVPGGSKLQGAGYDG